MINHNVFFFHPQFDDFSEKGQFTALDWSGLYPEDDYIFGDFTERLWAYLTIQQLLEKTSEHQPDQEWMHS